MVMEMNLLSLNSDGAFRTMMHSRMPHSRKRNSTEAKGKREGERKADLLFDQAMTNLINRNTRLCEHQILFSSNHPAKQPLLKKTATTRMELNRK